MAKTFSDWPDKAKHSISYAQHQKNVKKGGGGSTRKIGTGTLDAADVAELKRRGTLAKWQKDPGLRSRLPDTALGKTQAQERALQTRLNSPVAPGSLVTGRELARQAKAASTVEYGPQEQQLAQQLADEKRAVGDVAGWYDQYQQQVAQGARNVADIQAQAAQRLQALSAMPAVQAVPTQTAPGGPPQQDLGALAAQAQASRQNLVGSFQAQQVLSGAAQQGYMDQLAQSVAPAQKRYAVATQEGRVRKVADKQAELAKEKGAYEQKTRGDILKREEDYGIAALGLGIKAATATGGSAKETTYDKAFSTQAANHGYTPHQWALLGRKGRERILQKDAAKKGGGKGPGDHYGYTDEQWAKMSPEAKRKAYKEWQTAGRAPKAAKPEDVGKAEKAAFRTKFGVDLQDTKAHNKAKGDIQQAGIWLGKLSGDLGSRGRQLTTGAPASTEKDASGNTIKYDAVPKFDPVLIRAAMDIKQYGGIKPSTAVRLHKAGYSVATLGLKNAPTTTQRNTAAYGGYQGIPGPS